MKIKNQMMIKQKRLNDALFYIGWSVKEGFIEDIDIKSMTDDEIIKFADDMSGRAEAHYDSLRDEGLV